MKKGALASVTLFGINAPDKPVAGTLSLKGFTAAFDSLTPVVPPQQP
jgi:invasion protein IalB